VAGDLETVIASAVSSAGGGESEATGGEVGETISESSSPETDVETTEADQEADPSEGETSEAEAQDAVEADPLVPAKKQGPIPFDRHKKILENARENARQEFGAQVAELQERLRPFEGEDAQAFVSAMSLADNDPDTFAKVLLGDEKVGAALRKVMGAMTPAGQPAAVAGHPESGGKPAPDRLYEDGTVGYSAEALDKLLAWEREQTSQALSAQFDERLKHEFGEVKDVVEERRAQVAFERAKAQARPLLEEARKNWPRFSEFEADMREYLRVTPGATLESAYRVAVLPQMQKSEADIRAKVIEEMNGRKAAVLQKPAAKATRPAADGPPGDIETVIQRSLARAGLAS
jgi:hypothetical protein